MSGDWFPSCRYLYSTNVQFDSPSPSRLKAWSNDVNMADSVIMHVEFMSFLYCLTCYLLHNSSFSFLIILSSRLSPNPLVLFLLNQIWINFFVQTGRLSHNFPIYIKFWLQTAQAAFRMMN